MKIEFKFDLGEFVYLKTDTQQLERMITGYIVRQNLVLYFVTQCETETSHYDFELTRTENVLKTLN